MAACQHTLKKLSKQLSRGDFGFTLSLGKTYFENNGKSIPSDIISLVFLTGVICCAL